MDTHDISPYHTGITQTTFVLSRDQVK